MDKILQFLGIFNESEKAQRHVMMGSVGCGLIAGFGMLWVWNSSLVAQADIAQQSSHELFRILVVVLALGWMLVWLVSAFWYVTQQYQRQL